MLVSIVTICYNNWPYIKKCVESVVSQKCAGVEYIVVDAGSSDGCVEYLRSSNGIDRLIVEPDEGPADGLNKGFSWARGAIGYFINGDDFMLPGAVTKMVELWRNASWTDVILAGGILVDAEGRCLRKYRGVRPRLWSFVLGWEPFFQQGMSFRLECLRRVGGFNIENRTCWDAELMVRFLQAGYRCLASSERIGAFRLHAEGLSGSGRAEVREAYLLQRQKLAGEVLGQTAARWFVTLGSAGRFVQYVLHPSLVVTRLGKG